MTATHEDHRRELLRGVATIRPDVACGAFHVLGDAFAVLTAPDGDNHAAVVAAVEPGEGRVLVLAQWALFGFHGSAGDRERFSNNALSWLLRGRGRARTVLYCWNDLLAPLQSRGLSVRAADAYADGLWEGRPGVDLVILGNATMPAEAAASLRDFVERGGALMVAHAGWSHTTYGPREGGFRTRDPTSALLGPWGLVASPNAVLGGHREGLWFDTAESRPDDARSDTRVEALRALVAAEVTEEQFAASGGGSFENAQALALTALRECPEHYPSGPWDDLRRAALDEFAARQSDLRPSVDGPIEHHRVFDRLLIYLVSEAWRASPTDGLVVAPTAAEFPGAIPEWAVDETRQVAVPLADAAWISTGLYARPGRPVEVRLSPEAMGKGLRVRVGCHVDELYSDGERAGGCTDDQGYGADTDEWQRWPDVSFASPLRAEVTRVANPHGGLIYVEVPAPPEGGSAATVTVTVTGGVGAPSFALGRDSTRDWQRRVRQAPAPWAELACDAIILTVPSKDVRGLDDPERVLRVWQRVLATYAELDGHPPSRRPERIVHDAQIAVGLMHDGYPIASHARWGDVELSPDVVDARKMVEKGLLGPWHELGHNRQRVAFAWCFDGTGEVTCNLYYLHACDLICGIAPWDNLVFDVIKGEGGRARAFFERGASWDALKGDPTLMLFMFAMVVREFGWQPIKDLLAEYRNLPEAQRPRSDDERRDQFLVRLSRRLGHDLGPFLRRWGMPLSDNALSQVAGLPGWVPLPIG